jgi:hypothetical protein
MEFFIKKNATLPLLKMAVVKDGRNDYNNMMDFIEQSSIFFSMVSVDTGIPKISTRPAGFVSVEQLDPNADPEYFVYYQFSPRDTNKVGRYQAQFLFRNDQGTMILPIREELYVNVQESFIGDSLEYNNCYVSEFPCCNTSPVITATTTTICVQPIPLNLQLTAVVTSGSVVVDYYLTANKTILSQEVQFDFDHILSVYSGSPITISTGVTIFTGFTSGTTQVILDENFDNLSRNDAFGNIVVTPSDATWEIFEQFPITPTPTPTPFPTPTPSPIPETFYILTENGNVLKTENNDKIIY